MRNKDEITIYYVVGGNEKHYRNLDKSKVSIRKAGFKGKIKVFEFTKHLPPHLIWRRKYSAVLKINTPYAVYADSDTVMVNNNLRQLFGQIGEKIGVSQHFWTPTIGDFKKKAVLWTKRLKFRQVQKILNLENDDLFFTGGIFIFKNNPHNRQVFEKTLELYDRIYSQDSKFIRGITDELIFSAVLQDVGQYHLLSGALNHCVMGDKHMPLKLENKKLYGKNPFEEDWAPVTFLHCDTFRRDPTANYSGTLKLKIKEVF